MKKITLSALLIIGVLLCITCKKDKKDSSSNNTNNNTTPTSYYIHGTLSGATIDVEQGTTTSGYNSGMVGGYDGSLISGKCRHSQGSVFENPFVSGTPQYYIGVYKDYPDDGFGDCPITNAQCDSVLHTGSFGYASSTVEQGAFVNYVDAGGNNWSSETGSQTGSTFSISTYANDPTGVAPKLATYVFNCKIYNDSGAVKTFNATWYGRAVVYGAKK
jgi:hypothetical protein